VSPALEFHREEDRERESREGFSEIEKKESSEFSEITGEIHAWRLN